VLDLAECAKRAEPSAFSSLAKQLGAAVLRHSEQEPLAAALRALERARDEAPPTLQAPAQLALTEVAGKALSKLAASLKTLQRIGDADLSAMVADAGEDPADVPAPLFNVQASLARLEALLQSSALAPAQSDGAWGHVSSLLADVGRGRELPPVAGRALLRCAFLLVVAGLPACMGEEADAGAAVELAERKRAAFAAIAKVFGASREPGTRHEAFLQLANLALLFPEARWRGTPLAAAAEEPADALLRAMWGHAVSVIDAHAGEEEGAAALEETQAGAGPR
jgi:hypothetical protein